MPKSPCYKPVNIKPATGFLDTRSTPDEVPFGGYRWVENWEVTQKHRLCRMTGWRRLLDKEEYNNADLHNQVGYLPQPLTMGFEAESPAGFSKLYVASQSRLFVLNGSTDNWRVAVDSLGGTPEDGCSERRLYAAQLGNVVVFTNNFDAPFYTAIDQPPMGDSDLSVAPISDFNELNITKVGVVVQWANLMFYMNIVQDGERISNRIIWSDYKRALSVRPSDASLAGKFDLFSGEAILNAMPLGDALLVYTTKGIWEVRAAGTEQTVSVTKRYTPEKHGHRCLAYRNTLLTSGDAHYYWGVDGIYMYDFYENQPKLVDWIHRASAIVFDDLNRSRCEVHHGTYFPDKKSIIWSWAKGVETCPSMTMVVNTEFPFVSLTRKGFTMFTNCRLDKPMTVRDFILERCICTLAGLESAGGGFTKEGGFLCKEETDATCAVAPQSFYSNTPLVEGDIEMENYLGEPDADSLFALLGDATVDDLCGDEYTREECHANRVFIGAASEDNCLKEFADVYYRERCTSTAGCGTYLKDGYQSILRSGPLDLGIPDDDKNVKRFAIEPHPVPTSIPAQMELRIGISSQALDPNDAAGKCAIIWEDEEPRRLECLGQVDAEQHAKDGTRPSDEMEWGLYMEGRFLYYELTVTNPWVTPADTGGAVCLSRITFDAAAKPRC